MNEIAKTEIAVDKSPVEKQNDQIQQQFDEIKDKITTDPDAINRLNKNTLETVNTYLYANPDKATEMLLNISEAMTNTKLENKDRKSLLELETICLKRTNWENVWTYQLNRDVLNTTFDTSTLTSYGKLFKKWNTNDWFWNITETYTQGANPKFDELFTTGKFKNVHFTPAQLQKELYNRNTERTNQLVTDMKALTIEDIQKLMATAKITDIADITKSSPDTNTAIKNTFPNITDAYRELNYLLTKDPSIMTAWTTEITKLAEAKKIEDTNAQAKKNQENIDALLTTFTKDGILAKYLENNTNNKDDIYAFNSKNSQSKLGDIITTLTEALKKDPADAKVNELITLLKDGQLKEFQKKVYGEKPTSKYDTRWNDGKLGDETLDMVNTYLSLVDNEASVVAPAGVDNNTAVAAGADNNTAVTAGVDNNTAVTAGVDNNTAVTAAETIPQPVNNIFKDIIENASRPLTWPDAGKYENWFQDILTELHALSDTFAEYKEKYWDRQNFNVFEKGVAEYIQSKTTEIDNLRNKSATITTNTVRETGRMTPDMAKISADLKISKIAIDTWFLTVRDQMANQ